MAKKKEKSLDQRAKDYPLLAAIQEAKTRIEEMEPLLEKQASKPEQGDLDGGVIRLKVCHHVAKGLDLANREHDLDRHAAAAEVARLTGQDGYNAARLNKLAAPSQEQYVIRPDEIVAHRWVCDYTGLIEYLAELCGLRVVTPQDYALIEAGRLVAARQEAQAIITGIVSRVVKGRRPQA